MLACGQCVRGIERGSMPKFPRATASALVRALLRNGFVRARQRGSHVILRHADGRRTVVPLHVGTLSMGTLRGICDDLEMSAEDLREIL